MALQVNPQTGEPYLRLPPPHAHIIITPPRMADVSAIVPILNDPRVYMYIQGPPNPYLPEHGQQWLIAVKSETDKALRDLQEASSDDKLKIVDHCPVRSLREVKEDGTDAYLGDIGIGRWGWEDITNHTEKQRLIAENTARKPGDPDIVWGLGDYLAPSHHGQGIMTAAVATLLDQWWIPRMGVRHITISAFKGNQASVRVFEKNGFVLTRTVENCAKARGEVYTLDFLEWHAQP